MAITRGSHFFAVIGFAVVACTATSTFVQHCWASATAVVSNICRAALEFAKNAVEKFEQPAFRFVARPVELVQACAYALNLAKRERPHVRSQWRMCPSV